jgi:hypothetical protein
MRRESVFGQRIELTGASISLNRGIELFRVKQLEPSAESGKLSRSKLFNRLFDIFSCRHLSKIALVCARRKGS